MIRKGTGPAGVDDGAEKQIAGRGSHAVASIDHATDEFRDLARDLVAVIDGAADKDMICGCDTIDVVAGHDACWNIYLRELASDARRRLWLAELDGGRRG